MIHISFRNYKRLYKNALELVDVSDKLELAYKKRISQLENKVKYLEEKKGK